ncbi:hypothetical protein LOK49_LG15G02557 [Camellia lanceoleosa]|uniref:Uncharacterized protein n=1 Tax=Camellia lanceoleosa TaxID=1840588 RepID=A0ACC0F5N9_9ERIC|nr:hypothetical protein LOK49_LG15G02557 [Camellia lanceoleosa]
MLLSQEENDENYEEGEVVDVFDSDFDDDEPEPNEEVENEADDRFDFPKIMKLYVFEGALGAGRYSRLWWVYGFLSNLKGIVLDMAKSCTFPLPLLTVAVQQLIAGSSHGHGNDGDDTSIKAWEKVYGVNITNAAKAETYSPEELANQITTESKSVNRIGFIGLGAMGFGMATHLLRSNFGVSAYDVMFCLHLVLYLLLASSLLPENGN